MSSPTKHRLRKFRFERPQQIAAVLLLLFLGQCAWVGLHSSLSETDYRFARCGREMWEKPSAIAGYFTTCGNIHDGTLAYRAAGLPLTLERIFAGQSPAASTWEMRHQLGYVRLLVRLPFLLAGLALGACLWWVTRRLFGNLGGYFALALYCFSPEPIAHSTYPNNEILAAFGFFASIYTAMGVAHALQGPRNRWRPRILLLTLALGFTAAAHIAAFLVALLFAIAFLAYLAETRRAYLPTLSIFWAVGALLLVFASYGFHPDAYSYLFRSASAEMWFSFAGPRFFFSSFPNAALTLALLGALVFYASLRRSRYFGNTAPLLVFVLLLLLVTTAVPSDPLLWALPFLIAFLAGVYADMAEMPRRKLFLIVMAGIVLAQAALSLATLPSLTQ